MHKKGEETQLTNFTVAHTHARREKPAYKVRVVVPYGTHQWATIRIHSVPIHLSVAKELFHVYNQSNPPKVFGNRSNICSILFKDIVRLIQTTE